jgi:hypothetical protein
MRKQMLGPHAEEGHRPVSKYEVAPPPTLAKLIQLFAVTPPWK